MNATAWLGIIGSCFGLLGVVFSSVLMYRQNRKNKQDEIAADLRKSERESDTTQTTTIQGQMTEFMALVTEENKHKNQEIRELNEKLTMAAAEITGLREEIKKLRFDLEIMSNGAVSLPVPYWCKNMNLEFIFVNSEWTKLTGLMPSEVYGKTNQQLAKEGLIPQSVADDWDSGDKAAIDAKGEKVIQDETTSTAEATIIEGRSGKWTVKNGSLDIKGLRVIWGMYVDFPTWVPNYSKAAIQI